MSERHLPPEGLALLVLDMQKPFIDVCHQADTLIRRVRFAIRATHLLGIPVFFTEQVPEKLGGTLPELLDAAEGSGQRIPKHTFSAMRADELTDTLLRADIQHLLIAGIETSVCVYQTIVDCLQDELQVTLLTDCHGGRRAEDAQAVLQSLHPTACNLLPAETVFYSILATTKHPAFKAYTQLVKDAQPIS